MSYSLGIDSSTQSCSALVIDASSGNVVAEASVNFGEKLPQYNAPSGFIPDGENGEVHADPRMWLDALEMLLNEISGQCDMSKIRAVSGAGQQHGSVYLNNQWLDKLATLNIEQVLSEQLASVFSRATSPIWMDSSTANECCEISAAVGGDDIVCAKSGSIAVERFTGPQIRRFYKTEPEAYTETSHIHLVSSFLCSVLVGANAPIDTGDGAGMNLVNIETWQWDAELLDATAPGLLDKLPEVKLGDTVVGSVSEYFVKKFGFSSDVPVTIFTGDNPSSLVGMGAGKPGKVVVSLGTSDTFFAAMDTPVSDPAGCGHVFGNAFDGSGGAMALQCFVNGSLAREAVKNKYDYDWEQFTQAFSNTTSGNEGNLMVPFFTIESSPRSALTEPLLSGEEAFEKWDLSDAAVRACVEGQFLNMKRRTAWIGVSTEVIYLTGGASKNDAIAQVVADVFQAKVERLAVSSSVALGGAMRAASNSLKVSMTEMEKLFCQPDEKSRIIPKIESSVYELTAEAWDALCFSAN